MADDPPDDPAPSAGAGDVELGPTGPRRAMPHRKLATPDELVAESARREAIKARDDERWLLRRLRYRAASAVGCGLFAGAYAWFMCGGDGRAGLVDGLASAAGAWVVLRFCLSPPWSLALFASIILVGGFGLGAVLPASAQPLVYGLRWPFASMGLITTSLILSVVMHLHDDDH